MRLCWPGDKLHFIHVLIFFTINILWKLLELTLYCPAFLFIFFQLSFLFFSVAEILVHPTYNFNDNQTFLYVTNIYIPIWNKTSLLFCVKIQKIQGLFVTFAFIAATEKWDVAAPETDIDNTDSITKYIW